MIRTYIFPALALCLISSVAFACYPLLEPNTAHAVTQTAVITLNVTQGISLTGGGNVLMSRSLGVSGADTAVGTSTFTVVTNDPAGYTLGVNATSSPAMQTFTGSATTTIANYAESVAGTPETWTLATGKAAFGYSAFGPDTPTG